MNVLKNIKRLIFKDRFYKKYKLRLFYQHLRTFNELDSEKRFPLHKDDLYPCLEDNLLETNFDAHYIYHPAWAARIVRQINPDLHVDISSILHFCTMLSAFVKVEFYDYRPAKLTLDNLESGHLDLARLPFSSNSLRSVSCMHTIEHIGLGRYGDPLDPDGDLKAINELKRICAINGNLLIVVPVGVKRIQFNAHRIYNPFDVVEYMAGFELRDFSLINDQDEFIKNAELSVAAKQKYGCGCYWFVKREHLE